MPPRPLICPSCRRVLGTVSHKRDHRGRGYDRVKLRSGVHLGHILFRGDCAVCPCGERVLLPDTVTTIEFPDRT